VLFALLAGRIWIMGKISDIRVVATSTLVSVSDLVLNVLVAVLTGSTVMLSQALQGLSDLITGGILYFGVKRSHKEADDRYQFGYGREVFFWVLVAGIVMFAGTGGLSVYFGYQKIMNPDSIEKVWLALLMLLFGFSTNLYAFRLSLRRMKEAGDSKTWWRELPSSSMVETKATLLIDFLGTVAAGIGLVALITYVATGNGRIDGTGSLVIGFTMMLGAVILIRDVRDLIVGKAVGEGVARKISVAAKRIKGVEAILDLRTMYLGSAKLLVVLEVHLSDGFDTDTVELITDRVKAAVLKAEPLVHHVQVEIETPEQL
jgi:cation diffusion facilitator family transporter